MNCVLYIIIIYVNAKDTLQIVVIIIGAKNIIYQYYLLDFHGDLATKYMC